MEVAPKCPLPMGTRIQTEKLTLKYFSGPQKSLDLPQREMWNYSIWTLPQLRICKTKCGKNSPRNELTVKTEEREIKVKSQTCSGEGRWTKD